VKMGWSAQKLSDGRLEEPAAGLRASGSELQASGTVATGWLKPATLTANGHRLTEWR